MLTFDFGFTAQEWFSFIVLINGSHRCAVLSGWFVMNYSFRRRFSYVIAENISQRFLFVNNIF